MTTPRHWMEAIEMRFAAIRSWLPSPHDPANVALGGLRQAATYAWSPEPTAAVVTAAQSIPDTAIISDITLPEPAGFWWFGSCVPGCRFNALLWNHYLWKDERRDIGVEDVCLTFFMPISDVDRHSKLVIGPITWPMQVTLAEATRAAVEVERRIAEQETKDRSHEALFTEAECRTLLQLFMAACVWLQQRILVTSTGHIERHRRKQLAREHNAPLPGDVKIIELRRRESTSVPNPNPATVEWSCQWVVNGHWTHQPYGPGQSERRLQYVLPYVKGPSDKPLKVPTHTVYVVDR